MDANYLCGELIGYEYMIIEQIYTLQQVLQLSKTNARLISDRDNGHTNALL